ncbi:NHL domain-containing thioredoxin family protein [Quadrisphaera sp. DSM 44207]|uniref:NHL domain-containing thioredoxin family protein n=1 Tax=Quadrisphaera sp. DSM 44207 TaxID=1881057 RepID=UPI000885C8E3|nr:NHL domain-containing thioredoxin family protein [Quadrisphaera sp. DSM 44207]SDQ88716.1 Thiol-disulfide isomerase or thioredoxin [Quadrisphaera sp. DSM 44207]
MTSPATARRARVRAPQLSGRRWLGTGGRDLDLAALRGKVVLLDFWTSCCVNCLHVLDELRPLEEEFSDVLVVVGVHSPKFAHEGTPQAVDAAVQRYDVRHPVLDDPQLVTWQAYAARAWPTLVVVDPEGYVVASLSGEGHAHGLAVLIRELVAEHGAKGALRSGTGPYTPPPAPTSALSFPGAVLALPAQAGGGLLVSDTAHHQLVLLEDDLETERYRIGTGQRGLADGGPRRARFAEPAGLALLPPDVAARVGWDVAVADSAAHAVRGVRLADGAVVTVAGTGEQLRRREGGGPALAQELSTPMAVAWFDGQLVIAMAGVHQLWALDPAADPAGGVVRVLAGTTAEGLRDGAAEQAWFAQTSGLAVASGPDGEVLWLADAETSALRHLRRDPSRDRALPDRSVPLVEDERMANVLPIALPGYEVGTAVGTGLFDFGFRDGDAAQALLQHPLGVAVLPDGSVAVADTYNGAVRRYDPAMGSVGTLARDLAEPAALLVEDGGATLVVVESAAHRLVRLPVPAAAQRVDGAAQQVRRPPTQVAPGPVALRVAFTPPTGQELDDRWGDPTRLVVSASPPELLVAGAGDATGLVRDLVVSGDVPEGVLHVSVQAAACDGDPQTGEVPEHAACHLYQQDWGIPVRTSPDGASTLDLDLRGV